MDFVKSLKRVRKNIGEDTKLIVVTKGRSARSINQLLYLGVKDIGESRVSEGLDKKPHIKRNAKWHMIGHLQRNKVGDAVKLFDMIQSLDSLRLARKIDRVAKSQGKIMAVLVQVNISRENQKHGLPIKKVLPFLKEASSLKNIKILGLMAVAPHVKPEQTRRYFREMRLLFEDLKKEKILGVEMKYLSMGVSDDYKVAVGEGANMVLIGREIYR